MILHCPQAEIQTTGVTSKASPDPRRAHLSKFLLCTWRFCDLETLAALRTKSFAEKLGAERLYLPPLPHPACCLLWAPSTVNSAMDHFRPQSRSTVITLHLNYLFIRLFSLLDGELLVAVDFVPTLSLCSYVLSPRLE